MKEGYADDYKKYGYRQYQKGLKLFELAQPQPNENVLDVGCGTGELTYKFAQAVLPDGKVVAFDPNKERIHLAEKEAPAHLGNIVWLNVSAENFKPVYADYFDIVYSNYVLHWLYDQFSVLQMIYRSLRPGGRFALQVVHAMPEFVKDITLAMGIYGGVVLNNIVYSSPTKWKGMLTQIGFKIQKIQAVEDYHFANLDEFILWWEATTDGMFNSRKIATRDLAYFKEKCANGISLYGKETLLLVAQKPQ